MTSCTESAFNGKSFNKVNSEVIEDIFKEICESYKGNNEEILSLSMLRNKIKFYSIFYSLVMKRFVACYPKKLKEYGFYY